MLILLVILAVAAQLVDSFAVNHALDEIRRLNMEDCAMRHALRQLELHDGVRPLTTIPLRCLR